LAYNHFQCEDYKWKCQFYITDTYYDLVTSRCNEAASNCCETADHVKSVTNPDNGVNETVGLYNECKCDFWLHLCEDTRVGDACDYAAEYCCGDYKYWEDSESFLYLNSPFCYCNFFSYVQNELGHQLKPKALNISKEFPNPCGQFNWRSFYEKKILKRHIMQQMVRTGKTMVDG